MSARSYHGHEAGAVVARQLDRPAKITFRVGIECPYGWPAALVNAATGPGGEPNPNLYYVSCPYLRKRLSQLEDTGLIAELQELLAKGGFPAEDMVDAQARHRHQWLVARGRSGGEPERGPPNIADTSADLLIKCLHAHYAFHLLSGPYMVGYIIAARLSEPWCGDDICRRLMEDRGEG